MGDEIITPTAKLAHRIAAGELREDPGQREVAKALDVLLDAVATRMSRGWLQKLIRRRDGLSGLYIHGGVGRGKTMLMDMFFETLTQRYGLNAGWRMHFHDFMVAAQDLIHAARETKQPDPIASAAKQLAARGQVLCFDEMEVRDIADAMIVARLFRGLFDAEVVLITTSNRHPDDLYKDGLHRDRFLPFIALLKDQCRILEIPAGEDWRGAVLAGMRGWYSPDDKIARQALGAAFTTLRGAAEPSQEVLRVAGRDITIGCCAGDIALVDFAELCAQPLAARDYLAVAGRFAGILLRGVPVFTGENEAAARRFMWLVDALYDRSRFLIASAEAEIDHLYKGHHYIFEFSRTASRLVEMTSREDWLQSDT